MRLSLIAAFFSVIAVFLFSPEAAADPGEWGLILDAPSAGPKQLQFFDEVHGIGLSTDGFLLTGDGGHSWREVRLSSPVSIRSPLSIEPSGNVWVLGGCPDRPGFLHSPDRGQSWECVPYTTELLNWPPPVRGFEGCPLDI